MMTARLPSLLTVCSLAAACGSADPGTSVQGVGSGLDSGIISGGADAGTFTPTPTPTSTPTPTPTDPNHCLEQPIDTHGQSPDMLILLDKSASMAANRWGPSVAAVTQLVNQYQASVQFGLSTFPSGDGILSIGSCSAGNLDVPMALNNAAAITQSVNAAVPLGATPTAVSLQKALEYLGPRASAGPDMAASRPGYVLLVTDGEPTCPDTSGLLPADATLQAAMALSAAGIKVYVVGYQVGNTNLMNQIAQAGGTNMYFPVENGADLQAAFQNITKDVVRCDFDLASLEAVPDPSYIDVTIDGVQRKLDETDGWTITGKHITLMGQACSVLKDGMAHNVEAVQRCEPIR